MKQKLLTLMCDYRDFHTKKWTVFTHFIGVPLVTFSILLILGWVKISIPGFFTLSTAWIGIIILAVYYLYLDLLLGAATTILLVVLSAIASLFTTQGPTAFSGKLFLITFILGWIFQLIGHAIEGKKPALLTNFFESVFIAPFFIIAELFFMFGIKKELQQTIDDDGV